MARFLLRRLALTVPVLFGVTFLTFMLVRIGGSDPTAYLAGPTASAAEIAALRAELGLDRPLLQQYLLYLGQLLSGDWGRSWNSANRVADDILSRLPASLELVLPAVLLGAAVAIPLGMAAASRPGGLLDHSLRAVSLIGFSAPSYVLGLLAIFFVFYAAGLAPPPLGRLDVALLPPPRVTGSPLIDGLIAGDGAVVRSAAAQMVLPVLCLAIVVAAPLMRHVRAVALEAFSSEPLFYARALGFPPSRLRRLALRHSLAPIITFLGSELAVLFAAVSLLELVFSWGGLGQYGLAAILQGDFAAVQGYVLTVALLGVVIFLVTDIAVLVLEPRARRAE
jgi:peptide/nickel transport system permease protein